MRINLMRSILISLGFMVAYALLRPLGLGWLVTLAFVGVMGYLILRLLQTANQQTRSTAPDDSGGDETDEREGFLERMKGKRAHGDEERTTRAQEARARAQQEADCALTHEERVKFQNIVKGLNDAG